MLNIAQMPVADLSPAELSMRIAEVRNTLALIFDPNNVTQDAVQALADFRSLVEAAIQRGVLKFKEAF
jgi:hypothetical protein